jgi:hypothetical protein
MQSSSASAMQEALPGFSDLPEGFRYKAGMIDAELEQILIEYKLWSH